MQHPLRFTLPTALATLTLLALPACGSSAPPSPAGPPENPALADVIYEGTADQTALEALLAAPMPVAADPEKGAVIDNPRDATLLPPSPIPAFRWHLPTPASGAAHFLVFSTDTEPKVLRVFTTETAYTPDEEAWEKLSASRIWTTLMITTGAFEAGKLAQGGGPFIGQPVAFCIER